MFVHAFSPISWEDDSASGLFQMHFHHSTWLMFLPFHKWYPWSIHVHDIFEWSNLTMTRAHFLHLQQTWRWCEPTCLCLEPFWPSPCDPWHIARNPQRFSRYEFVSSNFFLVNYYLVTFGIVTDRRTDRKWRIRVHRALAQVGSKHFFADLHWSQKWSWEMGKIWNQIIIWRFSSLTMLVKRNASLN